MTEVAPGVYVHQGRHEETTATNAGDIANIGFIVGRRCIAVIDTGGSPSIGSALHETIRSRSGLPVCYVINTHVHPDHILGNHAFREEQPVYVGHHRLPQAMALRGSHYVSALRRIMGTVANEVSLVPPTLTVEGTLELDLGERRLVLTAHPTAHTDNDLSVLDVQTQTLWLSDLLFVHRTPVVDGSVLGWLAIMDRLRATEVRQVVPGHGPVAPPWPQALNAQHHYLEALRRSVREAQRKGATLEEAVASVGYSKCADWLLFDQYHKRNVTAVFAELEWADTAE